MAKAGATGPESNILLEENEVIRLMCDWLASKGWVVDSRCMGVERGTDIVASQCGKALLIEAKGARAGRDSKIRKREKFDRGQIKDHLGKAIVKAVELKASDPKAIVGIAHPDTLAIRSVLDPILPELLQL